MKQRFNALGTFYLLAGPKTTCKYGNILIIYLEDERKTSKFFLRTVKIVRNICVCN